MFSVAALQNRLRAIENGITHRHCIAAQESLPGIASRVSQLFRNVGMGSAVSAMVEDQMMLVEQHFRSAKCGCHSGIVNRDVELLLPILRFQ